MSDFVLVVLVFNYQLNARFSSAKHANIASCYQFELSDDFLFTLFAHYKEINPSYPVPYREMF